jgi:hypothetical protein
VYENTLPDHEPGDNVSPCPISAVPETIGRPVFRGGAGAGVVVVTLVVVAGVVAGGEGAVESLSTGLVAVVGVVVAAVLVVVDGAGVAVTIRVTDEPAETVIAPTTMIKARNLPAVTPFQAIRTARLGFRGSSGLSGRGTLVLLSLLWPGDGLARGVDVLVRPEVQDIRTAAAARSW